MKRIALLAAFLAIAALSSAQGTFSPENLQSLSESEFERYMSKALKTKKNGAVLTWMGVGTTAAGLFIFNGSWAGDFGGAGTAGLGLIMMLTGPVLTLTGIPVWAVGTSRVSRMNSLQSSSLENSAMNITPSIRYDNFGRDYYPGVTISLTF